MATKHERRQFLKRGAVLAGLAAVGMKPASATDLPDQKYETDVSSALSPAGPPVYGVRSHYETVTRAVPVKGKPFDSYRTPLHLQKGIITPASLHYYVSHGSPVPDINPAEHRLMIHGMVERPVVLTMDEIKTLPFVSRILFLQCAGQNYGMAYQRQPGGVKTVQQTHGDTSCSEWSGVAFSTLMEQVRPQKSGSWLVAEGAEWKKHAASIPLEKAMDEGIVAYYQNGEAIRPENGYPLRLILPGVEGMRNVRWLRRLYITDRPTMNAWEINPYSQLRPDGKTRWFDWDMEPNSVITFPSGEQQIPGPGDYMIRGLAWTGTGAVGKVQVSTDGAKTWEDAKLHDPVLPKAHTQFSFPWRWDGKEALVQSRSIDEWGNVQPTRAETEKMWNVEPGFFSKMNQAFPHYYASQPWRISQDGKVSNAMWD